MNDWNISLKTSKGSFFDFPLVLMHGIFSKNRWACAMATRVFFQCFDGVFHQDSSELPCLFGNEVGIGEAAEKLDPGGYNHNVTPLKMNMEPQKWRFGSDNFPDFLQVLRFLSVFLPDICFVNCKRYGIDNESGCHLQSSIPHWECGCVDPNCWAFKNLLPGKINQVDVDFLGHFISFFYHFISFHILSYHFISFLWSFQHKHVKLTFPTQLNGANRSQLPSPCGQRQVLQGLVDESWCNIDPNSWSSQVSLSFFEKRAVFVDMIRLNTRLLPAELLKPELPEVVARGGEETRKTMAFPWDFWRFANAYGFSCCSGAEYQPSRSSRDSRNSREPLTTPKEMKELIREMWENVQKVW